ncbi:MAG: DUF1592 domain-containing protein [Planctomycetaceae bacterium]|jgi:hypothetical protein|nr:DUF1592 domain-containing protein [Planctomycetaceae bacterium]
MLLRVLKFALPCWLFIASCNAVAQPVVDGADADANAVAFFKNYCMDCHNEDDAMSGIRVDHISETDSFLEYRRTWKRVVEVLRFGTMPPKNAEQPSAKQLEQAKLWVSNRVDSIDCDLIKDPGRVTIRRLNRLEYNNTVRDLFAIDFKPADDFPSDDVGEGFDNIGDVLSLPPLLLEKYLAAAEQISERIVYVPGAKSANEISFNKEDISIKGNGRLSDLSQEVDFYSNGIATIQVRIKTEGKYEFSVDVGAQQAGPELAKMELAVDSKSMLKQSISARKEAPRKYTVAMELAPGQHKIELSFTNDFYNPNHPDPKQRDRNIFFSNMKLVGPTAVLVDDLSDFNKLIHQNIPEQNSDVKKESATVLNMFIHRVFRREVNQSEIEPYCNLVQLVVNQGESFQRGIQVAMNAILVSPRFIFRLEGGGKVDSGNTIRDLDNYELASRLSYFVWCSTPDDELLNLAREGKLSNEKVLRAQLSRMLTDPRVSGLTAGFATQWLNLRNLAEVVPDPNVYDFPNQLRDSMQRETELFFEHVLQQNRSVIDFINGKYTFVNQTLARHYGLSNIEPADEGDGFMQVSLEGVPRSGVLTHGSILTLTSNPNRTAPVMRGKWIMENILGVRPPDPPADVPEIAASKRALPNASFREQLNLHRENAVCASCHDQMDPLGFGFENFDGIGKYRTKDGEFVVDSTGILPSGEKFNGPMELVDILTDRGHSFARTMTERMLVFALGRGLDYYDECAVDKIMKQLKKDDYRFQTMILHIVISDPFLKRRNEGKR